MRPLKVCCIINGTGPGGAERMLGRVLKNVDPTEFELSVISLNEFGLVAEELQQLGIPVHALNILRKRVPKAIIFSKIVRLLRTYKPDVVQTWMYLSDLFGGLAAKVAGRLPVIWNIRHSTLDPQIDSRNTIWTAHICGLLSRWVPHRIVLNAEVAQTIHVRARYAADKMEVIPNGFDLDEFRPSRQARCTIRKELALSDRVPLVGLIGRFHPHKDHDTFFRAASIIGSDRSDVRFLLSGGENVLKRHDIQALITNYGLHDRFSVLGHRSDVAAVYASLDVVVSSSLTEGFPNVVGEAMACGIPCIATNVGDSATIVGDTGRIVPVRNAPALANAVLELLKLPRESLVELGRAARQRVAARYSIRHIATQYAKLWKEVAATRKTICVSGPRSRLQKAA